MVDCDSGLEGLVAVLGTVGWVGVEVVIKYERVAGVEKTDLNVDQRLVRACTIVFGSKQCPKDGPPFKQEALLGIDWWLRVRRDIRLAHELASCFSVSSLVAVVVDVDVEPVV